MESSKLTHSRLASAVESGHTARSVWKAQAVDGVRFPFVTFVFRYRSLGEIASLNDCMQRLQADTGAEALKVLRLIPRTPSPPALEDRDTLSAEEVRELQRQFKAIKVPRNNQWAFRSAADRNRWEAAAIKVKRERTDDNPRPRKSARPSAGDALLELDDDGEGFRDSSTATLPDERVVIELD